MKKGFTLIELSIVLVIIGVLVGGILVGQSLIESAKLGAFVRQMQQIEAATNLFKSKYKAIPGDADLFRPATRNPLPSSGVRPVKYDGYLCDDDCAQNTFWVASEMSDFFLDLNKIGGLKFDNCPDFSLNLADRMVASGPDCNMPIAKMGKNAFIFVGGISRTGAVKNAYFIADCTGLTGQGWFNSANGGDRCYTPFTGAQALAYDAKIDDGNAITGDVLSSVKKMGKAGGWSLGNALADRDGDQDVDGSQGNYNASSSEETHNLIQAMKVY